MSTMNIYDMADTWNDGATTFSAIKMSVTDTASASGSLLMDLQVGGVSRFKVNKAGGATFASTVTSLGWYSGTSAILQGGILYLNNSGVVGWGSSGSAGSNDLTLYRDAANTLAQRNGVNAQAFRVYGTYTDASNFKRAYIGDDPYAAGTFAVGSLGAGTGGTPSLTLRGHTNSSIILQGASANIDFFGNLRAGADNTYDIGAATASRPRNVFQAGYWQTSEMTAPAAPAANGVRIYAEDDGAGKTRLMALFATGVAQQIAIEP